MNICTKAPEGGAVSHVNGEFYKGGRFMPETGEFCGAKRRAKKHAYTEGNWKELIVRGSFVLYRIAGETRTRFAEKKPFSSHAEAVAYAEELIRLRAEAYKMRGYQPHPTELTTTEIA